MGRGGCNAGGCRPRRRRAGHTGAGGRREPSIGRSGGEPPDVGGRVRAGGRGRGATKRRAQRRWGEPVAAASGTRWPSKHLRTPAKSQGLPAGPDKSCRHFPRRRPHERANRGGGHARCAGTCTARHAPSFRVHPHPPPQQWQWHAWHRGAGASHPDKPCKAPVQGDHGTMMMARLP